MTVAVRVEYGNNRRNNGRNVCSMKRFLCLVLAVVLCVLLAMPAVAVEEQRILLGGPEDGVSEEETDDLRLEEVPKMILSKPVAEEKESFADTEETLRAAMAKGEDSFCSLTSAITLTRDLTVPEGGRLYIQEGASVVVPEGVTLTIKGSVYTDAALIIEGELKNVGYLGIWSTGAFEAPGYLYGGGRTGVLVDEPEDMDMVYRLEISGFDRLIQMETDVTLREDLVLGEGECLVLDEGAELVVPKKYTVENNGVIQLGAAHVYDGTIVQKSGTLTVEGSLLNEGTIYFKKLGKLEVTGSESGDGDCVYWYEDDAARGSVGWAQYDNGNWAYGMADGTLAVGWLKIDGEWYWFETNGIMGTYWQWIDDGWYYFASDGAMRTGWEKIGGLWYYFDDSGVKLVGWVEVDGKWYYLDEAGVMVSDKTITIDGEKYTFDENGALVD